MAVNAGFAKLIVALIKPRLNPARQTNKKPPFPVQRMRVIRAIVLSWRLEGVSAAMGRV